jgi:hypothetical protein
MPDFKRGDVHDMAIKTAESQALKRCATNLGDQFGLSLYRNGSADPVVTVTLVGHAEPENVGDGKPAVDEQLPDVVPDQEEHGEPTDRTPPPPTFDELLLDGEHATSTDALNALARRAVAVHAAGHLTEQQLEVLKGVVKARRADLAPSPNGDQS